MPGSCDCHASSSFAVPQCKVCSVCAATGIASLEPGKWTQTQFHCCMAVCLQSLQQQATWQRLQPHTEAWCVCDMQGGPRGRPNCSWPQQSQGRQRRHHLCSVAGNLIHLPTLSRLPTHPPSQLLARSLARSLAHPPTHTLITTPRPPTHPPTHPSSPSFF